MPTCQHCLHKWTWKQTIKRSFTLGGGMKCPYCNEMQYYSARFRKTVPWYRFLFLYCYFLILFLVLLI